VAAYLDTSALVKLVVAELETAALIAWIGAADLDLVSSDLARTELLRAVRRAAPDRVVRAREVLDSLTLLELTTQIFEEAARVGPPFLRTLDALHLAVALDLGDDLETVVTYDDRLADAANANGVRVTAPA
jgi:predicted nucleic acid-binding protein